MQDPAGKLGYFEQKFAEFAPDRVVATRWTVTLDGVEDRANTSRCPRWRPVLDGAARHRHARPDAHRGAVRGDRVILLYNRRYGDQGIVMAWRPSPKHDWPIAYEGLLYDARAGARARAADGGLDEMIDSSSAFRRPSGCRTGRTSRRTGASRAVTAAFAGRSSGSTGKPAGRGPRRYCGLALAVQYVERGMDGNRSSRRLSPTGRLHRPAQTAGSQLQSRLCADEGTVTRARELTPQRTHGPSPARVAAGPASPFAAGPRASPPLRRLPPTRTA